MMDFNKKLVALLIVSVFLLSSCEVYQTLYGAPNATKPAENVSMENVTKEKPEVTGEATKEEEPKVEVKEEIMEKPTGEKPVVVVVQETDLVSLSPRAEDPDRDTSLVFTFTSPLSENGEWQTNYGDADEYTVTVTVSDGESTTARDVLIIVNKKEEAPTIDSAKPIESGLAIDETQAIEFTVTASDLNKDSLSYAWKFDGTDVGNEDKYTYQSTYEDAGTHTIKVEVSDGLSSTSKIWSVDIKNVNRQPVLEKLEDISAKETDKIVITALATDDDRDSIAYSISDNRFAQEDNAFTWQTDYASAGTYEVTITASDGQDTTEQKLAITVENVNRPPVITDIVQKK
ncbi:PKD domain-containing protein [Candidatus Woesearchaeota archaeon]|nr:PKD domain-containing protein [Candidatus Woesearchaeota archaeon]